MMFLAQAEAAAKAATDLVTAQDVLPFFQAATVLGGIGTVFFFLKWQGAEKTIDDINKAALERAEKMIARLTGAKESDSRA